MKKIIKLSIAILFFFLLIGIVNAAEDNSTNEVVTLEENQNDDANVQSVDESKIIEDTKMAPQASSSLKESKKVKCKVKASPIKAYVNQNRYFKISVSRNDGSKINKQVPLLLSIKVGKKYRFYALKTNTRGIARFGIKHLPVGIHKVIISTKSKNYKIYARSKIIIKQYPPVIIKMKGPYASHAYKIVKKGASRYEGYTVSAFYSLGGQSKGGVYVDVDGRSSWMGIVFVKLIKAKFFFKNNKNGRIKTRFVTKSSNYYEPYGLSSSTIYTPLISGYTPIYAKAWYKLV